RICHRDRAPTPAPPALKNSLATRDPASPTSPLLHHPLARLRKNLRDDDSNERNHAAQTPDKQSPLSQKTIRPSPTHPSATRVRPAPAETPVWVRSLLFLHTSWRHPRNLLRPRSV